MELAVELVRDGTIDTENLCGVNPTKEIQKLNKHLKMQMIEQKIYKRLYRMGEVAGRENFGKDPTYPYRRRGGEHLKG